MEEIDLIELFYYYLKRIPYLLLSFCIGLFIGAVYVNFIQVPMYKSSTTIALVQQDEGTNASINQSELTLNQNLVSTYGEIIKSRRVLEEVIKELKINYTYNDLYNNVNVSSVDNTSIIKVTVDDKDGRVAADIANNIAEVFSKDVTDIYNLKNVSVIDKAVISERPYNVKKFMHTFIIAFAGLMGACVVIFIIYYFDDGIKTKKEIEDKLNIAVLAEIPVSSAVRSYVKNGNYKERKSYRPCINISSADIDSVLLNDFSRFNKSNEEVDE